jgi:hypothetical protein
MRLLIRHMQRCVMLLLSLFPPNGFKALEEKLTWEDVQVSSRAFLGMYNAKQFGHPCVGAGEQGVGCIQTICVVCHLFPSGMLLLRWRCWRNPSPGTPPWLVWPDRV